MNIWIDIDDLKTIPLIKALINELQIRGHQITLTAEDRKIIRSEIQNYGLNAEFIGKTFSLFQEFSSSFRAALLVNYINKKNIDIAFSLGATPICHACSSLNLTIILLHSSSSEKFNKAYFILYNIIFLLHESVSTTYLIEKGYSTNNIMFFKNNLKKDALSHNERTIIEIATKLESACGTKDIKA